MKNLTHTCHYVLCTYDELTAADRQLIDAAKAATQRSYAPYSHFHVGAAALLADGTVVTGTNQENAAYPSGLCAERTTLFYAGSAHPDKPVVALAIAAYTDGAFTSTPIAPCGACREYMMQLDKDSGQIQILTDLQTEQTVLLQDLIPDWWGTERFRA